VSTAGATQPGVGEGLAAGAAPRWQVNGVDSRSRCLGALGAGSLLAGTHKAIRVRAWRVCEPGTVRHRSDVVEYRVEQHAKQLKDRLAVLGIVTRSVTRGVEPSEKTNPREGTSPSGDNISDEWARRDSNARPLAPEDVVSAQASAKSLQGGPVTVPLRLAPLA